MKNYADYFGWAVESAVDENDLERDINNRMNGKELETALMRRISSTMYEAYLNNANFKVFAIPEIENVIFNPPATIVFWTDGTKTVVKCQNHEEFDPEKGLSMAFFKKMHGNKGHYFEEIKKWTDASDDSAKETPDNPRWHIWYKIKMIDTIYCYEKDYFTKSGAVRRAKKLTNDPNITAWCVSQKDLRDPERFDAEWHFI